MKTETVENFEVALALFVDRLQEMMNKYYAEKYPNLTVEKIEVEQGRRYAKIVKRGNDGSGYVYCFVDKTNGNILKPAGWKAPAKHARGNIFNDNQLDGCNPHGVAYLR